MGELYGKNLFILQSALDTMLSKIELLRHYQKVNGKHDPVEHCKGRIKSEDSMIEKLKRKGYEVTTENALSKVHDAVGIRIVCGFVEDSYQIAELIRSLSDIEVVKEKDYIANPKPNGYRSYHMIVKLRVDVPDQTYAIPAEIQIRTIAEDSWASLEHQLKYKKDIDNVDLIQKELKRCSDEMASTDLTMQTVRQMIHGEEV